MNHKIKEYLDGQTRNKLVIQSEECHKGDVDNQQKKISEPKIRTQ